jgi:outer membrane murein-binding lipoprotein Lpp
MKTKRLYLAAALGLSLALTGCSGDDTEPKAESHTQEAAAAVEAPHSGETAAPKADSALSGSVVETFDSGGYTYILLDNGQGQIWAAIGATKIEVGQKLELTNGPVMKEFHSRSLDRTFPEIIFSAGIKGEDNGGHGMMGKAQDTKEAAQGGNDEDNFMTALGSDNGAAGMDPAMATGGSSKAVVNAVDTKVDKAAGENAYTVEEIHAKAKDLNGKKVVIQAKVVKVSPQIMGKNWLHLQDGSGNPMKNTHDLVITTEATPALDSVITIEGVVAADKDFGAGYFYEVIVEEGVVK